MRVGGKVIRCIVFDSGYYDPAIVLQNVKLQNGLVWLKVAHETTFPLQETILKITFPQSNISTQK
jgi:hypothetical protein